MKTGRGQVIDLAQYEAVAQTNGNTLPLFTGEGRCMDIPATGRRASSPTTRSNAATAGSLSARSAARSTTRVPKIPRS